MPTPVYTTKPHTYSGTWLKSKLKASYKANGANNTLAPAVSITISQILGKGRLNNFCAPKNTPSNNTAPAISKLPNHTLCALFVTPACACAPYTFITKAPAKAQIKATPRNHVMRSLKNTTPNNIIDNGVALVMMLASIAFVRCTPHNSSKLNKNMPQKI